MAGKIAFRTVRANKLLWIATLCMGVWIAIVADDVRAAEHASYVPLQYRTETWQGSTFWGDGAWGRVGRDWHHPGDGVPQASLTLLEA